MAQVTTTAADKLNRMHPTFQELQFGTTAYEISQYSPVVLTAAITAAANATAQSITVPFAMRISQVFVEATAASVSGTVTVRKGTNAITDAIACATDKAVTAAGSIDDAQSTLAAGDSLNVITNGANDRGFVTIIGVRV